MSRLIGMREGWDTSHTFADGETALQYLFENEVDVVITDIQMPGISGLDMIEKVRKVNREIPIIIISGYGRFDYAQRAIDLGVYKYITKPVSPDEIMQTLEQLATERKEQIEKISQKIALGKEGSAINNLLILRAIEYLHENYMQKLTLQSVSDILYISPNYFSSLFHKVTGDKFSDYLLVFRMEKSKQFLSNVAYKVSDVAELVGFSDARYFISAFNKKYGVTPGEYRNLNCGKPN